MSENRYLNRSKQRESLLMFTGAFALFKFAVFPLVGRYLSGISGNLICYILWAGLAAVFYLIDGFKASDFGFSRTDIARQLTCGIAVGAAVVGLLVVAATVMGLAPAEYLGAAAPDIPSLILNCAFYLFIVGPFEEFIFRGYLLHSAEKALTPFWGILISSAIFGLSHLNGGILQIASTFLIGLAYAVSLTKLKSCTLLSVMVAHSLHNLTLEFIRWFFC